MSKKKVVIAGSYPPPVGGVTIHTKRLKELLDKINYDNKFIELRPKTGEKIDKVSYWKSIFQICKNNKGGVVHYQLNNWLEAFVISVVCKIFKINMIMTIHSFTINKYGILKQICFYICKLTVDKFIAPSYTIKEELKRYGVRESKIFVIDTYLPPSVDELEKEIPSEIINFMNKGGINIVSNASRLYKDCNGIDVYGLDMCIEACAKIKGVNFIFCAPEIIDHEYLDECKNRIKELNIDDRFFLYTKRISLVSLLRYCDLMVRPTNTDSFGISIAEAIFCDVPAIASDVCEREKGTITFKARDLDEFIDKINMCITSDMKNYIKNIEKKTYEDYYEKYIDLYENNKFD